MKSGDSPLSKTGEKPSSLPKLKTRVLIISTFLVGLLVLAFLLPRQRKKKTVQNLDSEIAAAQRDLKTNPQDLKALALLGTCYFKKGPDFYPQGVNALEEARSLGSLDPDIFYYLGIMYQNLGFYPFALKDKISPRVKGEGALRYCATRARSCFSLWRLIETNKRRVFASTPETNAPTSSPTFGASSSI